MSNFFISIVYGISIGLALSVDAFMLSLIYGSTFKRKIESITTSIIVGFFHFFMPLLGYFLALFVFTQVNLKTYLEDKINFIAFIILCILGFMMLIKKDNKDTSFNITKFINKCLFAFSVSIDSFLAGIAFTTLDHINIILVAFLFAIVSFTLTLLALLIGKTTADRLLKTNLDFYAGLLIILLAIISLFI